MVSASRIRTQNSAYVGDVNRNGLTLAHLARDDEFDALTDALLVDADAVEHVVAQPSGRDP